MTEGPRVVGYKRWATKTGKDVCNEQFRLPTKCGMCGPNWGDMDECKALCDVEPTCKFFTFFSDRGCRIYSSCAPTWPQAYGVVTSIYEKKAGAQGAAAPVEAPPAVAPLPSPAVPLPYEQEIAAADAVCDEVARLAAPCGACGPNWGDLGKCKTMCDKTPQCKFITYLSDGGCRMYSKCDSKWHQHYTYSLGPTKSAIFKKGR